VLFLLRRKSSALLRRARESAACAGERRFTTFTSIRFIHTDTTAAEKLMIGYDYSGAGSIGISSIVLDVDGQS